MIALIFNISDDESASKSRAHKDIGPRLHSLNSVWRQCYLCVRAPVSSGYVG